jgi:hypothetical protein
MKYPSNPCSVSKTTAISKVKTLKLVLILSIIISLSSVYVVTSNVVFTQPNPSDNGSLSQSKKIRHRSNRTRLHKPLTNLTGRELYLESLNSVDYYACCGLGHRLTKLSDAWYVARNLSFALKTFWGFCDERIEVFSHLFGTQPESELTNVQLGRHMLQFRNQVPGMQPLVRSRRTCRCDGHEDKVQADLDFYRSLYSRFQFKTDVEEFMLKHAFRNHTVLGVHVRAGNGEAGDFTRKKRTIDNPDHWVKLVVGHLQNLLQKNAIGNPLLYVATDTPDMIVRFRTALPNIPVVDLPQERAETGVLFGEKGAITESGSKCLNGWVQAMTDMMLLSSADIVIASRPSSFVQSMPQALVFGARRSPRPFCEMPPDASWFKCYATYREWCCTTSTAKIMQHMLPSAEYIRMPEGPFSLDTLQPYLLMRRNNELVLPMQGSSVRGTDLPFSWENLVAK